MVSLKTLPLLSLYTLLLCSACEPAATVPETPLTSPSASSSPRAASTALPSVAVPTPTTAPTPIPTPAPTATPKPTTEDPNLEPPVGIKAVDVQISSLLLTWEASDEADAYRVYLNNELLAAEVSGTAYQVKDLKSGNRYVFSVSALKDTDKESPRSKSISVNFF